MTAVDSRQRTACCNTRCCDTSYTLKHTTRPQTVWQTQDSSFKHTRQLSLSWRRQLSAHRRTTLSPYNSFSEGPTSSYPSAQISFHCGLHKATRTGQVRVLTSSRRLFSRRRRSLPSISSAHSCTGKSRQPHAAPANTLWRNRTLLKCTAVCSRTLPAAALAASFVRSAAHSSAVASACCRASSAARSCSSS